MNINIIKGKLGFSKRTPTNLAHYTTRIIQLFSDSPTPAIARSLSFGPNSDGMILLEIVNGRKVFPVSKVDLIHAFPCKTELDIISGVEASLLTLPIAPALLHKQLRVFL